MRHTHRSKARHLSFVSSAFAKQTKYIASAESASSSEKAGSRPQRCASVC